MIQAHSLQSMVNRLSQELPRKVTINRQEPIIEFGLMTTFTSNRPIRYQTVRIQETRDSKLVGILFCHPKTSLAKAEIVDQLAHFHERSSEAVDFFCVGYGAYWPSEYHADQKSVATIEGVDWYFSEKAFSQVIDELEAETKWEYSGETELILLNARKNSSGDTEFDFQGALVCNLEKMSNDKAFTSVRSFFTKIFKYAKTHSENDPAWGFSDSTGVALGKSTLKDAVFSLVPTWLSDAYKRGESYAVRSIAKDI